MFLRRVQVPDFRVLKDVDLTFEPEFTPRVFPLGSLNGGGKSTLLQLIFILLSCSGDPEKHVFIQNMFDSYKINPFDATRKPLAEIELVHEGKNINLEFIVCTDIYIAEKFIADTNELSESVVKIISLFSEIEEITSRIDSLDLLLKKSKIAFESDSLLNTFMTYASKGKQDCEQELKLLNIRYKSIINKIDIFFDTLPSLKEDKFKFICPVMNKDHELHMIVCKYNKNSAYKIDAILSLLSKKTYLAAPFTQIFQFLHKNEIGLLFKEQSEKQTYYSKLENAKNKLSNLFTYDVLSTDYIISFIKLARDKDFKQAIETGEYGDCYQTILKQLNFILGNKSINIDTDLSGVNFQMNQNGAHQELYPEDLSHGELKRLSIYAWLKYKEIEDSIVLIDEIENAFHPDWQYQIISDLAEWGASNQYILATHSYELCQALTPAHVKELEPKLLADEKVEN